MTIGGDYDSPEKEYVRRHLWDPAFSDLIQQQRRSADAIVLLDLPGAKCAYLTHIIDTFGIVKTNIVAAEQYEEPFLAIHSFLEGSGTVFEGRIEELCERDVFSSYFPIDVGNLDFCGQGFVFPNLTGSGSRSAYQRRWDCIKYLLESNRRREHPTWYLLLTLSCDRNNPQGREYLLAQLDEINKLVGIRERASGWSDGLLIQYVVPKIIADEALHVGYVPHHPTFDSFRYVQTGHRTHMVAWRIRLDLDTDRSLGSHTARRNQLLRDFCMHYCRHPPKEIPKSSAGLRGKA